MIPDQKIGPYKILAGPFLGGFSAVYKVFDTEWGDEYALKMLRDPSYITAEQRALFQHEIALWRSLPQHRNVVRIYRALELKGIPCIVMEWVGGGGLEQRLPKIGQLGISGSSNAKQIPLIRLAEALGLMYDVALGMLHIHQHGIVHGDLKPANILMKYGSVPMVSDFGFSHRTGIEPGLSGAGTPKYMAPEQFGGVPTQLSDIFTMGMIYEEILGALKTQDERAEPVRAMIGEMTAQEPGDRPASFLPIIQQLDQVMPKIYAEWTPFDPGPAGSEPYTNLSPTFEEKTLQEALPERYLVRQAETHIAANDLEKARGLVQQALNLHPEYPDALLLLAGVSLRQKDYPAAHRTLEEAQRVCAGDAARSLNIAVCYMDLDDLDQAESIIRRLASMPDYNKVEAEATHILGKIYERRGSVSDAIDYYRNSLAIQDNSEVKHGLAIQLGEAGLLDEAIRLADEIKTDMRLAKRARVILARLYVSNRQFDEAINLLNDLIQEDFDLKDTGYILSEIGYVYLIQDRYQEAAAYYERCLQIDPANSIALRQLKICKTKTGG